MGGGEKDECLKLRNLRITQETINRIKRRITESVIILADYIANREASFQTTTEFKHFNS